METSNNYDYSIFKPVNEFSRRNRNIILSIILIWAICTFGFQFLLLILQKPVPEKALTTYNTVSGKVLSGDATLEEQQAFAGSLLMVLGKTIKPDDRKLLDQALTQTVYNLLDDSSRATLLERLTPLYEKRTTLAKLNADWESGVVKYNDYKKESLALNEEIIRLKNELGAFLTMNADQIFPQDDAFRQVKMIWLPYELKAAAIRDPQPVEKEKLDRLMNLYLTHNQSFLTDRRFLGFPFHYFYTAVFLLALFIGLCILYAYRVQHLNRVYGIEE